MKCSCYLFLLILSLGCTKNDSISHASDMVLESSKEDSLYRVILENEYSDLALTQSCARQLMNITQDPRALQLGKHYYWKTMHLMRGTQRELDKLLTLYDDIDDPQLEYLKLEIDFLIMRYSYSTKNFGNATDRFGKTAAYIIKDKYKTAKNALIAGLSTSNTLSVKGEKLKDLEAMIAELDSDEWSIYHAKIYESYMLALDNAKQVDQCKKIYEFLINQNYKHNLQTELIENWFFYSSLLDRTVPPPENKEQSILYLKKGVAKSLEINYLIYLNVFYRMLGHHYFSQGKFHQAYTSYDQAVVFDSINSKMSDYAIDSTYKAWALYQADKEHNAKKAMQLYDASMAVVDADPKIPEHTKIVTLERKLWSLPKGPSLQKNEIKKNLERIRSNLTAIATESSKKDFETQFTIYTSDLNHTISKLKLTNTLKDKKLKNKNLVMACLLLAFLLVARGMYDHFLRFRLNKKIKARNYIIQEKNDQLKIYMENLALHEKKLALSNNQLQEELENREDVILRLEKFAMVLADDFKIPLTSIKFLCATLDKTLQGKLSKKENEFYGYIESSSDRLKMIIDHLYNFSLGTVKLLQTYKHVELDKVIHNIKTDLYSLILETKTTINVNYLGIIDGDEGLLHQLFLNLISNAIKYRSENLPPLIEISAFSNDEKYVVKIKDNGKGIKESNRDLFKLFARSPSQAHIEGKGVGLATCKEIVDLHGGEIWYISEENMGTTFFISFPILNNLQHDLRKIGKI